LILTKKWALGGITLSVLAALLLISQVQPSYSQVTTNCSGFITSGTINGDLVVPPGDICTIFGPITVTGDILVGDGASLFGNVGSTVQGNIQTPVGSNCDIIFINGFTISGNIQADGCNSVFVIASTTVSGNIFIENTNNIVAVVDSTSAGNIIIINGGGTSYQVWRNTVTGNIQIENNIITPSSPSPSFVGGNTMNGNLKCSGNSPPPVNDDDLGLNTVLGSKQDQCSGPEF